MAPRGRGGMGGRPGPYDRMERGLGMGMGGGGGGGGGMGGGMGQQYGRGGRARGNIKGIGRKSMKKIKANLCNVMSLSVPYSRNRSPVSLCYLLFCFL